MQNISVVICGCTKNSGSYIFQHLLTLSKLGKLFQKYKLVIYENDSTDNTVVELQRFKKHCAHFTYLTERGIDLQYRGERVPIICHGRNKLLETVFQKYGGYDRMIMMDLDNVMTSFEPLGFVKAIAQYEHVNWAGLTANCKGPYYDIWALRMPDSLWASEIHGLLWEKPLDHDCWNERIDGIPRNVLVQRYQVCIPEMFPLIPTVSSFGGLGIYKLAAIRGCSYNAIDDGVIRCEHVDFHRQICAKGGKLFLCPAILMDCPTDHIQRPA